MRGARLLLMLCLGAGPAAAHHGVAEYDMDSCITLEGTVAAWQWGSPHIRLRLDVATPDGDTVTWNIEGAPPAWMDRKGFTPDSLAKGDTVTVRLHPLRRGDHGGVLMSVTRPDGTELAVERPEWLGGP